MPKNAAKMAKRINDRIKPPTFDPFDLTSITGYQKSFKLACATNGIRESALMRLLNFFMNGSTSVILNAQINADSSRRKPFLKMTVQSTYLTTHPQVENFPWRSRRLTASLRKWISNYQVCATVRHEPFQLCEGTSCQRPPL